MMYHVEKFVMGRLSMLSRKDMAIEYRVENLCHRLLSVLRLLSVILLAIEYR